MKVILELQSGPQKGPCGWDWNVNGLDMRWHCSCFRDTLLGPGEGFSDITFSKHRSSLAQVSASEWCKERFQAERMYSTLFNLENWLMMVMSDLFFRNHVNFSDEC